MVDVQRRRLLEVLGMLGSATALLGALPEVVHAYNINNTIVDPRSVGNSLITPSTCDVIVQPGQSPTGQSQPMVVTSDGTVIVDSSGTVVSSLGCNSTYTGYVHGRIGYGNWQCPGGQTLTAGIQEAINYIINTKGGAGGVVCIAPGTYQVQWAYSPGGSSAIWLTSDLGLSGNITIRGAGMDNTVIQLGPNNQPAITPSLIGIGGVSNIVIRDLTLLPYDQDYNPAFTIGMGGVDGLVIDSIHVRGSGQLTTCTASDGTPYPCVACAPGQSGFSCTSWGINTGLPVSSNIIVRNSIFELTHAQLNLRWTQNVLVENNIFRYSLGDHIIVSYNYIPSNEQVPVTNVVIRNNKFLFAGDTVIDIISLHGGWVIEGNYIETAGNAMLLFSQTETDLVINNVIRQYAGAENGITTGFEASANPGAIIIGNRIYNSPGVVGRYIINNYMENVGGITTFPGTGTDWYIVGNVIRNTPFGIRCGGLYNVNGCTGVVANNKVYMYGQAGPMGGGVFDFRGPIYNTLIVNNYIEGPPLSGSLGCSDYYMPYGIRLTTYSTSQGNVITGNTIVNAACAYPLGGKVLPCACGGFPTACGTAMYPIQVASTSNVIRDNVMYAVNGQYNYGNLEPIPPGILSLSLTSGTAVQNPYPFDLELEIPVSITATPASVQVYIGQSQSSLSLILQRQYNSTGTDTISVRLPVGWWIQVNTTNASIGTPVVTVE